MEKMWAGRTAGAVNKDADDFNSSIHFDSKMYKQDITGSMQHAAMLAACGIISESDSNLIIETLEQILADINDGKIEINPDAEDIHMFVEAELTARIGDVGKRLHTARSRNDQVALDIRLYLRDETNGVLELLYKLIDAIKTQAEGNINTIMPGYTHLQRAQPVTFAHYILAYARMFLRDLSRLSQTRARMNVCPLGSGALASTTYPIDRHMTAALLGFDGPMENSIDGVSDRDSLLELAFDLSVVMMHLSRFSEEMILWCSSEFGFIELDDAFSTGSSIMPQKKNPDIAELVRGKTGRVYGDLTTLLTMMKGLPLAYNKDMQEDKEAIFDAVDNAKIGIELFTSMLETAAVRADRLRKAASGGFINATDCADYLVKKGMPFRDAYKISGRLVAYCIEAGTDFESLPLETYKTYSPLFAEDVYEAVNLENCVDGRLAYGGPSETSVRHQIALVKNAIQN